MKFSLIVILLLCVLMSSGAIVSLGQDATKKCKSSIKGGKYKRASFSATVNKPGQVAGNVLVSPKLAEKSYFIELANRLKHEYCNADAIIAVVFDSKEKMNSGWEIYNRDESRVRWRAVYRYNKTDNIESIEIFDSSGDPQSKEVIDLRSPS